MTGQTWDVALTPLNEKRGTVTLSIPAAIGRALIDAGLNRAVLEMTADGLLFRPYKAAVHSKSLRQTVVLPFATTETPA